MGSDAFYGHVGGDDFVVLLDPDEVKGFCPRVQAGFAAVIASAYTPQDLERGVVQVEDRVGALHDVSTMSLSVAVVTQRAGRFEHVGEIGRAAAELKTHVKRGGGGRCMVDRRRR